MNLSTIRRALDPRLKDAVVVASVSGGKDSTAMSLWLTEQGIEHRRVFMDTGWEQEQTYEFLREVLPKHIGAIEWLSPPRQMADLVQHKGMFPSRTRRFCTSELKVKPLIAYLRALDTEGVNTIGIRAAESRARASLAEWEWQEDYDAWIWRPIIRWTQDEVIAIHTRHGCPPNPLYLQGASRVGCWPCIFASKSELRHIADSDPSRVDVIRELEARVADVAEARQAAKGTSLAAEGYQRPTFFQAMGALRSEGKDGRCVPIDVAVSWARTAHGGRQYELFTPNTEPGCVRWGLCETGGNDHEGEPADDDAPTRDEHVGRGRT